MKIQPRRLIRYYYIKFLRLQGDPRNLARGTAIGVFTGLAPIIPFHTISILILAPILRGNIVAAFLASFMSCNPLTYFPQYYFSWYIGNKLTPYDLSWERIKAVMDIAFSDAGFHDILVSFSSLGFETILVLLIGGVIFAAPFGVVTYFLSLRFFVTLHNKRRKKHLLN